MRNKLHAAVFLLILVLTLTGCGCVSIPEDHMRFVMQKADASTAVVIDTNEALSGGADWPDSAWPQERWRREEKTRGRLNQMRQNKTEDKQNEGS